MTTTTTISENILRLFYCLLFIASASLPPVGLLPVCPAADVDAADAALFTAAIALLESGRELKIGGGAKWKLSCNRKLSYGGRWSFMVWHVGRWRRAFHPNPICVLAITCSEKSATRNEIPSVIALRQLVLQDSIPLVLLGLGQAVVLVARVAQCVTNRWMTRDVTVEAICSLIETRMTRRYGASCDHQFGSIGKQNRTKNVRDDKDERKKTVNNNLAY